MHEEERWQAVLRRDGGCDGRFVYAVRSTGIYCRPSCPARRPRREMVEFYASPEEAERAGYRPCRRCRPDGATPAEPNLDLVGAICRYLDEAREPAPTLADLGRRFGLSPSHLQRTFKRIVGVSPRQYAAARRLERFRGRLQQGAPVTQALYEAGYESASSAYDQDSRRLGMAPGRYRRGGAGMQIAYTAAPCPLGRLLVAATEAGICAVKLGDSEAALEEALRAEYPAAAIRRDDARLGPWVQAILAHLRGAQPHLDLPLDVRATAFQERVWQALRAIPYGSTRSYHDIAAAIGQPAAARAVARACAANPVALLIPCHRVIREDGGLGGYRWGFERKRALLDAEAGRPAASAEGEDRCP